MAACGWGVGPPFVLVLGVGERHAEEEEEEEEEGGGCGYYAVFLWESVCEWGGG